MGTRSYRPYTPSTRQVTISDFAEITKTEPEKSLTDISTSSQRSEQSRADNQPSSGWRTQTTLPHYRL